jgi:hypothetical protein
MIVTCIGMNGLMVVGLIIPAKKPPAPPTVSQAAVMPLPTVALTVNPAAVATGSASALTWTTTSNVSTCTASDNWSGDKTPFGAESTGRLSNVGDYTYTLTCSNSAGKAQASAKVSVTAAPPAVSKPSTSNSGSSGGGSTYCGGRLPCYSPNDVAGHGSKGNCWGWNGDRVINISGFDAAFHQAKSGISSIEISQICGKDLAPSLRGQVSAEGQTRVHNETTKNNSDNNERPYFVGYFDSSKP